MLVALALLGVGVAATTVMNALWQFILIWGFIVGIGAGGMSSVLAATVANRWFVRHRGLVLGILNSAGSTGQLIFIPVIMAIIVSWSWRTASIVLASLAAGILVLVWWLMRNDPSDIGGEALGESKADQRAAAARLRQPNDPQTISTPLTQAIKSRTFWLLCGAYYICGGTSSGLIGTHMIPHALDIGIAESAAAMTVGIMGFMNLFGTLGAGWLTDRVDSRKLLAAVFTLRCVSLIILPLVTDASGMFIFAVVYGLDWFATVPPVVAIAGDKFGKKSVGSIYGWIFLSHQIGGAMSAVGGGMIFERFGDYTPAFFIGALMAGMAAAMSLAIEKNERITPLRAAQPA
jgi:sugar phosphate permease